VIVREHAAPAVIVSAMLVLVAYASLTAVGFTSRFTVTVFVDSPSGPSRST